ncbi:hypothetical protein ACFV2U_27815 [Streptomyces sp. NPDC059697]|uniref:hypothetical protein n=1 Tax=Streptomyces sp. NPDC059697 TaxID=3346912 RepID=UPI0036BADAC1
MQVVETRHGGTPAAKPIAGWATPTDDMRRTEHNLAVDPVKTLHQIIAPGFEVREVPDGWSVQEYGD